MANFVFIFGGQIIADSISNNQQILNYVVGGIFTLTAIIQAWKMFKKKDVQHHIEHPEDVTKHFEERVDDINRETNKKG